MRKRVTDWLSMIGPPDERDTAAEYLDFLEINAFEPLSVITRGENVEDWFIYDWIADNIWLDL